MTEKMSIMTLQEFLESVLPLFTNHVVDRIDKDIIYVGKVSIYRVVNIIRIDIKPYEENSHDS